MDLQIVEVNNGGDAVQKGNDLGIVTGVENMPFLAMFSGNGDWWANDLLLQDDDKKFKSETEGLLATTALNSQGRSNIEAAMRRDVAFLLEDVPNTTVDISATIISDDRLDISVKFQGANFYMQWNPKSPANVPPSEIPVMELPLWRSPWLNPDITNPSPGDFMPYAVEAFTIADGASSAIFNVAAMTDEIEEADRITYINSTIVPAYSLGGEVILDVDGWVKYLQAPGENYSIINAPDVLYQYVRLEYNVISGGATAGYDYIGAASKQIVLWGTGSVEAYAPSGTVQTTTHAYAITGSKRPYIFHNDSMSNYVFKDSTGIKVTKVGGDMPQNLTSFTLQNASTFNTPATLPLSRCANLQNLIVKNTNIDSFNGVFDTAFDGMLHIDLKQNKLTVSAVDAAFNDFVANSDTKAIITFETTNQTPAAPPTNLSLAARTQLTTDGCTVTTD